MIKVYNGDAYAVQEDEYDRNRSLLFFLDGHTEEYIMIYRGDRPIKVLSYHDVLYNREIPEKVLYMAPDIFSQAREIVFSCEKSDRWNRAFAVCNTEGEAECILYYQENLTSFNYQVSEFEDYGYKEDLDFDVLSRANTYVFEEYDEYTAFICEVLERKFPEKEKIFLDENARLFSGRHFHYRTVPDMVLTEGCPDTILITSEREKDFCGRRFQKNIYSSLDIMTALFWRQKEMSCGEMNPDKRFLYIRFPLYSSGLGDVIRFCMTKVAMNEYRNLGYIPVIDLSIPGDGNSFSGGRNENVWEDFFEPLNQYRAKEVLQSRHVLLCDDKLDAFNPYMTEQYYNARHMRQICRKYLRPNSEVRSYIEPLKRQFFQDSGTKTLGVVARGTDYRHGGFDLPSPMEDSAYIELVKQKMEEWGCSELLLATEDEDILERFKQAGFDSRLKYIDQERYRYPDLNKPGIAVAKLKKPTNDYHDEMPYLAVLYLLAECSSLISNCRCGAFEVADYINGDAYEHRYCCHEGDVE